jgi:phosphate transport system permease protein
VSILAFPLWFVIVAYGFSRLRGGEYRMFLRGLTKEQGGRVEFIRWTLFLLTAGVLSFAFASLLTLIGYDPRGGIGRHLFPAQRPGRRLRHGLRHHPQHLHPGRGRDERGAVASEGRSLAAGATPWQTAIWVILPVAASGIFSAVMIGMGRAVGETMIVVMAAGNTPILDWNVFSGLRTLSANIAVELPEAIKDGTLYRTLFLAALTLFVMTFIINTLAELVRQRFRKRAFQL